MSGPADARRATLIALARAANAVFFLLTATYCVLTYSSFAYQQFIRPRMVASLAGFVAFHHMWHWVLLGATVLTLLPEWKSARGRWLAYTYVGVMALAGGAMLYRPILPSVENDALGLWLAFAFLVPPVWLALYDHIATARSFGPAQADTRAILGSSIAAAVAVWMMGAAAVPWRFDELGDFTTSAIGLLFGAAVSLVVHLALFMAIAAALLVLLRVGRLKRHSGAMDFNAIAALAFALSFLVIDRLVFARLSFTGAAASLLAACVALALTTTWAAMARRIATASGRSDDAFVTWIGPVPGTRTRRAAVSAFVLLPFASFLAIERIEQFDWDFLVQNLGVVMTWLLASACIHTMAISGMRRVARTAGALAVVLLAGVSVGAGSRIDARTPDRGSAAPLVPEFVLDAYATLDPSYGLVRRLIATDPPGASAFYAYISSQSLIQHVDVDPIEVDFARPLTPVASRAPHIFLFVIDSLRRDYLSPYNPAVTFTPAFDRFGREEFAFQRAFTRYGGTGLSMPAIWSGSMLLHKQYVTPFQPMNALEKLLRANGYHAVMGMDHITAQIVEPSTVSDELDRGRNEMQYDFCATLEELEGKLASGIADRQPVFAHTRSLNLHVSKLTERVGSTDPAYGGFQAPAAAAIRRMDGCFGRFVDFLRAEDLYDDSIVILTADHGDALGEARRWGHAYTLFPEIVRTPLLVHIPPRLRSSFVADTDAMNLSTDITPSLYALLGYEPFDADWMFGRTLFAPPGTDAGWRRRETALLASSYGPVYAVLRDNGRSLYVADGVNTRDYAYDLSDLKPVRVGVTATLREESRAFIRERLGDLAALYGFTPKL